MSEDGHRDLEGGRVCRVVGEHVLLTYLDELRRARDKPGEKLMLVTRGAHSLTRSRCHNRYLRDLLASVRGLR